MAENEKDIWDKLKSLGPILIPIVILILGLVADDNLQRQKELNARTRVYVELLSSREKADSDLRKDMFSSIIKTFLSAKDTVLDVSAEELLHLELLAYNFHEAINISPLFSHLRRKLNAQEARLKQHNAQDSVTLSMLYECEDRLESIAREVVYKQATILAQIGEKWDAFVVFEDVFKIDEQETLRVDIAASVNVRSYRHEFHVSVVGVDTTSSALMINLEVISHDTTKNKEPELIYAEFPLDCFDFPLINNTRLPGDGRCAVVLQNYDEGTAAISLLCFSGEYAAMTEKTYMRELVDKVLMPKGGEAN